MICCAFIAALLGALGWLVRPFRQRASATPLAWRLTDNTPIPPQFSLAARMKSFGYAFAGLSFVARREHNMRIHLGVAALVIVAGLALQVGADDWRWLIVAITLVLAAETMNTAVEQCCNALGGGYCEAVRVAKDAAAGAVLVTAIGAALIGASVFAPYASRIMVSRDPLAQLMAFCGNGNQTAYAAELRHRLKGSRDQYR